MPPKRPAKLSLAVGVSDDKPAVETAESRAAAAAEPVIGSDKFESHGLVVDKSGVRMGEGAQRTGTVSFDEIEIVKKLGAGCSAQVYLAREKATGLLYALKCIALYDKNVRDMLMAELQALFKSDCEALVDFKGATYREGQVAVVLEFMNLGSLDRVLAGAPAKRIPERVLAGMAFQMLWGLGYLACERRVHRDIKPQNVLVNTEGQVKLTDFGISRELSTAVLAKTFVGTFKHMAPERIMHKPYSYASDIWSLGLVLQECATGKYPYPESGAQIVMVMTLTEGEPPLPPRDGTFTDEFITFLSQCIALEPEARASAMDLLRSDWFVVHGIGSLEDAQPVVKAWLAEAGFTDEFGVYSTAAAAAASGLTA